MNLEKFTRKSIEAIQNAQSLAGEYGNQELTQAHLLLSLLRQDEGLIGGLMQNVTPDAAALTAETEQLVAALPKVSGGDLYLSGGLNAALSEAEKQAAYMKDSYVSVEHLFLGILAHPDEELKHLFKTYGVTKDAFLRALKDVRGNTTASGSL